MRGLREHFEHFEHFEQSLKIIFYLAWKAEGLVNIQLEGFLIQLQIGYCICEKAILTTQKSSDQTL
jgi:hypothetical protein